MKFTFRLVVALALPALLLQTPALAAPPPATTAPAPEIYFPQTGHSLKGKFLQYWQAHGGLPIFGYPLTTEFYEGGYLVQYFERNRYELHPELAGTPYEILLGLLGRERLQAEQRVVPPAPSSPKPPGTVIFKETGYPVSGAFLQYWQKYGGLSQFGYPITPEFNDGKEGLTVQYFERARFEIHPENRGTPYYVLLTLLGRDRTARLDPVLLAPWPQNPPALKLEVKGGFRRFKPAAPLIITGDLAGELKLLGGDNRVYASYRLEAGQPLTVYAAGMPGRHSLLLYRDGQVIAARWEAFALDPPETGVQTGDPVWDGFYPRVKAFLEKDSVVYDSPLDGKPVRGYRSPDTPFIWLRDHVYQSKGFKFFEKDLKGALDYFRLAQHPDGSFDDYFQYYRGYDVYKGQIEVEADREFLFIEGVWTAWQATGDDNWFRENLPAMERGLEYTFTDPKRWSAELGLVKRAFTIDTWDFEQGNEGGVVRRTLDDKTRWGIMHGDNTGVYHAARLLAQVERYFGRNQQADFWDSRAETLLQNLNKVSWNGRFYTHQVHLTPVDPTGVDEKTQLSLSNAYALNRGALSPEQAAALLQTYQARRQQNGSKIFAEWYSIDPPFPTGFGQAGDYVNGGVMPLVGGELARGAFEYGYEAYGLDILRRYWQLLDRAGGSYLWYHPDGSPGIGTEATLATDGWGSAAMLNALTEGLAGVVDNGKLYQDVALSPRWAATDRDEATVTLGYAGSGAYFSYHWQRCDNTLSLSWAGGFTNRVHLRLLLPPGFNPSPQVFLDNSPAFFILKKVGSSSYLETDLPASGNIEVR
jgi:hypothetical protein